MAITTISSREFNQDSGRAKRAAAKGPVFITDRGKPSHVLLTFNEYQRITHEGRSLADVLGMPGVADIDLESHLSRSKELPRPAEFD
jgi:prevent-host-death family protein